MSLVNCVKTVIRTMTTPQMRDEIKKRMLLTYCRLFRVGKNKRNPSLPIGVNLIGHIRGDFGLGESCRLVATALKESRLPISIFNLPLDGGGEEKNEDWKAFETNELPYCINLIHINPNELSNSLWKLSPSKLKGRYNIAFWLWELPEFPREWQYTFTPFDEIWTPAEFVSRALRKQTDKPVITIPYGLPMPETAVEVNRKYFGLPENCFLFLISYDGNSVSARKNPEGSIRAYTKAFSPEDASVGLVIKATHESGSGMDRMKEILAGYPNIFILTDSYSKKVFNGLVGCVDVYVSLHRAEGFGLVMAEAMLLGTPVIATNWSANTEFMDKNTACMVDAEIVSLDQDCPPYHVGNHWAKPDEEQAAKYMRKLYLEPEYRKGLAERAKQQLSQKLSVQNAALAMKQRLNELK